MQSNLSVLITDKLDCTDSPITFIYTNNIVQNYWSLAGCYINWWYNRGSTVLDWALIVSANIYYFKEAIQSK